MMSPTELKAPPSWFTQAINAPKESGFVDVDNCPIHYQLWGEKHRPGLVFVHGNGAHVGWWDFIAPFFLDHFRVAAFDLSGMGDSGHRPVYTGELFADEIMAVSDLSDFSEPPILIGHSFGGRLVLKAEEMYRDQLNGIIMADSPFRPKDIKIDFSKRRKEGVKPKKLYSTFTEARSRFRFHPQQGCDNDFIVDYIAERSIQQVDGGWTWKFDSKLWPTFEYEKLFSITPDRGTKLHAFIYGEQSALFPEPVKKYTKELLSSRTNADIVGIANACHHLFLDQPLAFVDTIKHQLNRIYPHAKILE